VSDWSTQWPLVVAFVLFLLPAARGTVVGLLLNLISSVRPGQGIFW